MLLKECNAGLQLALGAFRVDLVYFYLSIAKESKMVKIQGASLTHNIAEVEQITMRIHKETLELIECLSDGASSVRHFFFSGEGS